jgi:zinc transporter ZupT
MDGIVGTVGVTSICAFFMLLGELSLLLIKIPPKIEAATQHFSAGILIAAIAGELFPMLHGSSSHRRGDDALHSGSIADPSSSAHDAGSKNINEAIAMFIGFLVGILLMFGQKHILEHDEHERSQEVDGGGGLAQLDTVFHEIESETSAAVLPTESVVNEIMEDGGELGRSPKASDGAPQDATSLLSKPKLERGASETNRQLAAAKIVADMRAVSAKVQDILKQPQGGSERDALDDELSELHMLMGVLRRHIRGAEPMTKQQFDAVVQRTAAVEAALARLEGTLQLPGVPVQSLDGALSQIEDELRRIIHANIDTVHKFRRWQVPS